MPVDGLAYHAATSGLDYYGARYYDPQLGQFTSADPVTDGLNRYGYVKGNPETYTDPSGHRCITSDGGVCGTGGNGGGSHRSSEKHVSGRGECDNKPAICQQIMSTFHGALTQAALLYIAGTGSAIGMKILKWMLRVGKTLGDAFISWSFNNSDLAYTDAGGFIHMNPLLILNANGDYGAAAAALIHEGVESYYAIQYGVRSQASQQMDYLAQRYTGMYQRESGKYSKNNGVNVDNLTNYGADGLTFTQWRRTIDGKLYASRPLVQVEVQFGTPAAPGYAIDRFGRPIAVNGDSIAELDAAYGELYNPDFGSPFDPLPNNVA